MPRSGYGWFVAKGPPQHDAVGDKGGNNYYRRIVWNGNQAEWVDAAWQPMPGSPNYRDDYDLDEDPNY